jgi:hypothetical protein
MPYKTKADRERENWITLPEVVGHICSVDRHCDKSAARDELRTALAEGVRVLGPLRWEKERDDKPPPFLVTSIVAPTDTPPLGRDWLEAEINWETGRVRDDWGEYKPGQWRVLLMFRPNVLRLWPRPSSSARSPGEPTKPPRKSGGRSTAREEVNEALRKMREEGRNLALPQKKLAELVASHAGHELGQPNWNLRTIQEHISKWKRENGPA